MKLINFLGHTFLSDNLNANSAVLDLGGNEGEFSAKISKDFGSKVFVFEPVPDLFEQIESNGLVKKYQEAVMPNSGEMVEIHLSQGNCATAYEKSANSIQARSVSVEDIIKREGLDSIQLLKMDIEGPEVPILENIKPEILAKIEQMTVEFHDFLWPELNPRVEATKKRIEKLGYYCIPFSFFTNGNILFIKRNKLSFCGYLKLKFFARYFMGIKRRLG